MSLALWCTVCGAHQAAVLGTLCMLSLIPRLIPLADRSLARPTLTGFSLARPTLTGCLTRTP